MDNTDKLQIIYDYDYLNAGEDIDSGSLFIRSLRNELSGTASANNIDIIPSTEVGAYKWASIHLTGTWSATINVQGSNDHVNWVSIAVNNTAAANQQFTVGIGAGGMYAFPISFRYLRVRTVAYVSGTVTATAELFSLPSFPSSMGVAITQQSALTVGASSATAAAVPATAHYMGMLGQDGNLIGLRSGEIDSVTTGSLRTTPYLYDGTKSDRARTLSKIKNVYANVAGNTLLWAPAAGKRFRILACRVTVTANVAISGGGILDIRMYDGAAASIGLSHSLYCPGTGVTTVPGTAYDSGWIDLRNGYLSSTIDNSLNINLSQALTAGGVQTIVIGTEE
jgi:hypothetical protein